MLALGAYLEAMKKSEEFNVKRSRDTARILVDFGAPAEAVQYVEAVREKGGANLPREDQVKLFLVEVEAAKAEKDAERVGELLTSILEIDAGNGAALVQRGLYLEERSQELDDPEEQGKMLAKARASFRMALDNPEVSYDANLRYGQMLVRQRQFIEAKPYLASALSLKASDNLKEYVRRVERAAERQKAREEREAKERAEAEARANEKKKEEDK